MGKEDIIQKLLGLQPNEENLSIGASAEGSVEVPTEEAIEGRTEANLEDLAD